MSPFEPMMAYQRGPSSRVPLLKLDRGTWLTSGHATSWEIRPRRCGERAEHRIAADQQLRIIGRRTRCRRLLLLADGRGRYQQAIALGGAVYRLNRRTLHARALRL